jgi:UDP-2-acetamido-3-amino-2,3-dideoxy-glucuronate N-acetyltransferase
LEAIRKDKEEFRLKPHWLKGLIADVHPTVKMGMNTFVWSFAVICEGVEIGDNCVVGSGVYIGRNTKIGNGVRIGDKAHVTDHMVIENNVFIAPMAIMMNDKYPVVSNPGFKRCDPYLEEGCSLGCASVILPGVKIGKNSMVGAGAVVIKDVPKNTTWAGNPARKIR